MSVLFAIPLLLGQVAPSVIGEAPSGQIVYEIRLIDCETLGWRKDFQPRLHFGGHRAGNSAWIAGESTLSEMVERFNSTSQAKVLAAPKVIATAGDPAFIGTSTTRHFVVHAERGGEATALNSHPSPRPVVAPVDDGSQIRLIGHPSPEGLHLSVQVIDSRIAAVHVVEATASPAVEDGATVKVQVPEVSRCETGGEWFIPHDHGLILSLGVESTAEVQGPSGVRERLLLISTKVTGPAPLRPEFDPGVSLTKAMPTEVAAVPAPIVAEPNSGPGQSSVHALGWVTQAGQIPTAIAATPWGLLPIVPVEFAQAQQVAAEADMARAMTLPKLPSRNLPAAVGSDGRTVDPRTERDRAAERTDFTPFVDGQPVPSPQVMLPGASPTSAQVAAGDLDVVPASAEEAQAPTKEGSMIKVRLSLNLAKGFSVNVDLGRSAESSE